jgi:hypothetical protein
VNFFQSFNLCFIFVILLEYVNIEIALHIDRYTTIWTFKW